MEQLKAARQVEYSPPDIAELSIDALMRSPGADRLLKFQLTHVCLSKQTMGFLGEVEPAISEAQMSYTMFRSVVNSKSGVVAKPPRPQHSLSEILL
jgi:hypothetical protein